MQGKRAKTVKNLAPDGGEIMYKRRAGQVSMLESPEKFGTTPLNPKNEWVRVSELIPWQAFEERYAKNFRSRKGQPACSARMALGALIIKERNRFSDDDVVAHLAMNPYFQYFIGLHEFRYEAPFDASMLTRFRQRITPEMLTWVNDQIIGRACVRHRNCAAKPAKLSKDSAEIEQRFRAG